MRNKKRIILLASAALLLCSCGGGGGTAPVREISRRFPATSIPALYTDAEQRAEYMSMHYWDAFFAGSYASDSLHVNGVSMMEMEEQFASFATLLGRVDISLARKCADRLFHQVEAAQVSDSLSNVFEQFSRLARRYFFDPDSPYRNEDIYRPYLLGLVGSALTPEDMKPSYAHEAQLCSLNPIGARAADFRWRDASKHDHTLYKVEAEWTLLFFSNPGCQACKEIIQALKESPVLSEMVSQGRLAVVNVYIDEDIEAWYDYMDFYPTEWYNGYDPLYVIRGDVLYNVRAIPSLYLLDRDKTVVMKDAPQERIFAFLTASR